MGLPVSVGVCVEIFGTKYASFDHNNKFEHTLVLLLRKWRRKERKRMLTYRDATSSIHEMTTTKPSNASNLWVKYFKRKAISFSAIWRIKLLDIWHNYYARKLTSTINVLRIARLNPWRTIAGLTPCSSESDERCVNIICLRLLYTLWFGHIWFSCIVWNIK